MIRRDDVVWFRLPCRGCEQPGILVSHRYRARVLEVDGGLTQLTTIRIIDELCRGHSRHILRVNDAGITVGSDELTPVDIVSRLADLS